jgi:hypothetical protein
MRHVLFAYLAGFIFALTIALGALIFVMIAHAARARWFVVLRRLTGAIAATTPVFVVLFVPIALGVRQIYPWAGPPGALDAASRAWAVHAQPWLDVRFFVVRSFGYLLVWSALALVLRRSGLAVDERPTEALVRRERFVSAAGIPVMAFTLTFASFDWIMSLDARWSSDIFGLYVFAGAFAGAIGTAALVAWLARRAKILPPEVGPAHFHALGRVLLVTVLFWAYLGFAQLVLVWIADMERESAFYLVRTRDGWGVVAALLFFLHFAVPFLLLLSRPLKRAPALLALVGGCVVCAHALDVYWLVVPAAHDGMRLLDLAIVAGIVGVSASFGAWRFFAAPAIPVHDPSLPQSIRYQSP